MVKYINKVVLIENHGQLYACKLDNSHEVVQIIERHKIPQTMQNNR